MLRSGLRILCFHGISLADEHDFQPKLFMREETLRARLAHLRRKRHPVLSLDEALTLLAAGRLPARAVVITFDDGWLGTGTKAAPALQEYRFPSTLYVTTRDVVDEVPVFDVALRYVLWKAARKELDLAALGIGRGIMALDTPVSLERAADIVDEASSTRDTAGRTAMLREVAGSLDVDWREIESTSLFRLMDQHQLATMPGLGMDLQLHTHSHRFPQGDLTKARSEIEHNRAILGAVAHRPLVHFCYPSGEYQPHQFDWLRQWGIESASTCKSGFNYPDTMKLELRRFLDKENLSPVEFEAELSGFLEGARKARGALRRRAKVGAAH